MRTSSYSPNINWFRSHTVKIIKFENTPKLSRCPKIDKIININIYLNIQYTYNIFFCKIIKPSIYKQLRTVQWNFFNSTFWNKIEILLNLGDVLKNFVLFLKITSTMQSRMMSVCLKLKISVTARLVLLVLCWFQAITWGMRHPPPPPNKKQPSNFNNF